MKENKIKRAGLVTASPSEFLVHQRLGRTRFLERGRAAWVLPWIDRYALIPSSAHSVTFCADQITAENQGVEVSGFAIWSVVDPKRAVEAADFTDAAEAIARIGEHLRQVVESAIRHQVANFTLEDSLRKRGAMIECLKAELGDVANQWGLAIATVEVKTVRIMSAQLFENMQAKFRDAVRLESERSAICTKELIDRERADVREEAARRELAFRQAEAARADELRRAEIDREAEIEKFRAARHLEVELAKLGRQCQLTQGREASRREAMGAETALLDLDTQLEKLRFDLDRSRAVNRNEIATTDDTIERRRIEVANTKDATRLLLENLPGLLAGVNIQSLNLGDPLIVDALGRLARSIARPGTNGGLYAPGNE